MICEMLFNSKIEMARMQNVVNGVMKIEMSAHCLTPAAELHASAMDAILQIARMTSTPGQTPATGQFDLAIELLWELAMKARGPVWNTTQILTGIKHSSGVYTMAMVISAQHHGGWDSLLSHDLATEDGDGALDALLCGLKCTELAFSVLHETCRYRSGCVELATRLTQTDWIISRVLDLPLDRIQDVVETFLSNKALHHKQMWKGSFADWWMNEGYMLEQAIGDTLGRCLNGLVNGCIKHHNLFASLKQQLQQHPQLLNGIK